MRNSNRTIGLLLLACFIFGTGIVAAQSTTFANLPLTVQVNQAVCAEGAIQCTSTGHTSVAAAATNHNPVEVVMQLIDDTGTPVDNLTAANFGINTAVVPAGGQILDILTCSSACFSGGFPGTGGVYTMFVHPRTDLGNWKSGTYFVQVIVNFIAKNKPVQLLALMRIDIPF